MRPFRVAALLLVVAATAAGLEIPPPPSQWVTDQANILNATEEALLNEKLRNFEAQRGAQFIVYTFASLEGEAIEDFTIRCAERWKVGNKKYDNGLILFVFMQEKKIRFEVGYGLEGSITDAYSSRVIRDIIAPRFSTGDYAGGLSAGADAIIKKITTGEEAVAPTSPGAQPDRGRSRGGAPQEDTNATFWLTLAIFAFIFFILPMMSRRRRGGCGGCIFPFFWPGGGITLGGGGFGGGGGWGGGGFSGGGGSFGGGGATGGW